MNPRPHPAPGPLLRAVASGQARFCPRCRTIIQRLGKHRTAPTSTALQHALAAHYEVCHPGIAVDQ